MHNTIRWMSTFATFLIILIVLPLLSFLFPHSLLSPVASKGESHCCWWLFNAFVNFCSFFFAKTFPSRLFCRPHSTSWLPNFGTVIEHLWILIKFIRLFQLFDCITSTSDRHFDRFLLSSKKLSLPIQYFHYNLCKYRLRIAPFRRLFASTSASSYSSA